MVGRHILQKTYIALATISAAAGIIMFVVFALGLLSRAVLMFFALICVACAVCGAANVVSACRDVAVAPDRCVERLFLLKLGMIPCLLMYGATAAVFLCVVAVTTLLVGLPRFLPVCAAGFALLHFPGAWYGVQVIRLFRRRGKGVFWAVAHGIAQFCFPLDILDAFFLCRAWSSDSSRAE